MLARRAADDWPDGSAPSKQALVYLGLGDKDQSLQSLQWLQKACVEEKPYWFIYLNVDPRFDGLRAALSGVAAMRRTCPLWASLRQIEANIINQFPAVSGYKYEQNPQKHNPREPALACL